MKDKYIVLVTDEEFPNGAVVTPNREALLEEYPKTRLFFSITEADETIDDLVRRGFERETYSIHKLVKVEQ
jgi:hypothetical protein